MKRKPPFIVMSGRGYWSGCGWTWTKANAQRCTKGEAERKAAQIDSGGLYAWDFCTIGEKGW